MESAVSNLKRLSLTLLGRLPIPDSSFRSLTVDHKQYYHCKSKTSEDISGSRFARDQEIK